MTTTDDNKLDTDAVLRRAKRAAEAAEKIGADVVRKDQDSSLGGWLAKLGKDISVIADATRTFGTGIGWVKDRVIDPVLESPYIGPPIKWAAKKIYNGYYNFTHPYPDENAWQAVKNTATNRVKQAENAIMNLFRSEKKPYEAPQRERGSMSKHRAGIAAFMTMWALTWILNVPVAGDLFRYWIVEPSIDVSRMTMTATFNAAKGKGFVLNHGKLHYGIPVMEEGHDFIVTASVIEEGATTESEKDSFFFHSRDRLVNEVYSILHGHGPYVPGLVIGPIKTDANKCESVWYGSTWKLYFFKSVRGNPELLEVNCDTANNEDAASPTLNRPTLLPP